MNRNPQLGLHYSFYTNRNKRITITFCSKNGPTNNLDKGSATFVSSVMKMLLIKLRLCIVKRLEEAKGIYILIGNYQQIFSSATRLLLNCYRIFIENTPILAQLGGKSFSAKRSRRSKAKASLCVFYQGSRWLEEPLRLLCHCLIIGI